ncbi:signal recognition particle protein [Candidatus Woesearchaeota archaeon]|nr:MAG: signal recognition particle protein [Candidatus Woesearchaeota archaeon]
MVLEKLGSSLKSTLRKLTGASFVDEKLINELVKDIQRSLLQSDVNVKLVFDVTKRIKERALDEKAPVGLAKKEFVVNIVYEELVRFLGGEGGGLAITKKPFRIMLVGLFGNGKTTTAGKLARYYAKRNLKVAMVQTDTWRPAAYDQLVQLGKQVGVPVFGMKGEKDPQKIWEAAEKELHGFDLVICDTAGRDALSDDLIEELNRINAVVKPDAALLVMAADVGQSAQQHAEAFHKAVHVNGVIITKLDGTAKGGGALTACAVTEAPVRFIGTGEKIDEFEEFRPKGFVGRLLGMGDLEALLEKAKEAISEEQAQDLGKKFLSGSFNLLDLYEQMQAMKKMGPLNKVMKMLPGFGGLDIPKEALDVQDEKLQRWRYLMDSMTKQELEEPELISGSRLERIARGSGSSIAELRGLLKQYRQSKKLMKAFKGVGSEKDMQKLMQKMQRTQLRGKKRFAF